MLTPSTGPCDVTVGCRAASGKGTTWHGTASPCRWPLSGTAALNSLTLVAVLGTVRAAAAISEGFLKTEAQEIFASAAKAALENLSWAFRAERLLAEDYWHRARGRLWFQHLRRAGGTSVCDVLLAAVPAAKFPGMQEACQPDLWRLRDAAVMCDHNLSLVAEELRVLGGNAFAQEYGAMPGQLLLGSLLQRRSLAQWVFVTVMRDPWARFWSQLRYELAPCLTGPNALLTCVRGEFWRIGEWWSPTAHPDSILGVPSDTVGLQPALYTNNYYTRMLLNRTSMHQDLTQEHLHSALVLLERISVIVILEDFALSVLQLACTLRFDLELARPLLKTRVRPYEAHEAMLVVPEEEMLGDAIRVARSSFTLRNTLDYTLYARGRILSQQRVAACSRKHVAVAELRRNPPAAAVQAPSPRQHVGDPVPEVSLDEVFGCYGGRIVYNEATEQYQLFCPRSWEQHAQSWWRARSTDGFERPARRPGQREVGAACWNEVFSWAACCAPRWGPRGNSECWDGGFTYETCCVAG